MDADFIERIDDLDDFLREERFVQTDSNEQAYGVIRALDSWNPNVHIVTEEYFPEAVAILARIGGEPLAPNAMETMGFDARYWGNKLDAYPHWETAWWREVVQNSRDAKGPSKPDGPSRIDLVCRPESYTDIEGSTTEAMRVSAEDDGVGMDERTLRKAFLEFGGSLKPAGAVGGFGDAKELIIIPWLGYEIHTRDMVARGRHNQFEISKADSYLDGTRVTTWMPLSKSTTPAYAEGFIDRCYLPHLSITINGKRRKANLTSDRLVVEEPIRNYDGERVGVCRIYHNPRTRRRGVLVRSNGIFMYDKYVDPSKYKGAVLIELEGSPRDLFDQKRNSFSYRTDVRDIVDQFIARMTVDVRSALKAQRADKGKVRQLYVGTGALEVQKGEAARVAAEMAMNAPVSAQKQWKDGSISFGGDAVDAIVRKVQEQTEEAEEEPGTRLDAQGRVIGGLGGTAAPRPVLTTPAAVEVILTETRFASAEHAADALKLMAWQPIFLLVNEVDFFNVPSDVTPEKMKPTYKKLAELWMELCRFVLMRLGWSKPFGVGWIFEWDEETQATTLAAYTKEKDESGEWIDFLLLNPVKLLKDKTRYDVEGDILNITYKKEVRWKATDDETLQHLCAIAVHECTHMVNGISEHNEAFASAMTENMGTMFDMIPVAKKVRKAVASKAAKEAAERGPSRRTILARAKKLGLEWSGRYGYLPRPDGTLDERFEVWKDYDEYSLYDYKSHEHTPPWHSEQGGFKTKNDARFEAAKRVVEEAGGIETKAPAEKQDDWEETVEGRVWRLEKDGNIVGEVVADVGSGMFNAFAMGRHIGSTYMSESDAKRAVTKKLLSATKGAKAVEEMAPKDTGDPLFYRLWPMLLYAWSRRPEELRESTYEATKLARSLGSEVAGSGRRTTAVVTSLMQRILDEPEQYSGGAKLPVKLPKRIVRDLEWDGREAWNIFVTNSKVGGPMEWDDFELKRLARAVGAIYDLKSLRKNPEDEDDWLSDSAWSGSLGG